MERSCLLALLSIALLRSSAQLMVYGVGDPASAAITHLTGANVELSNAFSQTIDPQQVGVFSDSTASIGLDSGLVVSTGLIYGLMGPNTIPNMTMGGGFGAYDADLLTMCALYPASMYDLGILQMDLVPAGDTLEITYVFGSEEYDEYACSDKDDRMALFLSGPGLSGPFSQGAANIATLPATGLPISVNTLNRGMSGSEGSLALCGMNPDWLADTIYYINNDLGYGTQLDGYTVVLTARAVVVPGMMYHLKIAITDVNDGNFDSAVFLPEGAIRCTDLSTALVPPAGPDPCFRYDPNSGAIQLQAPRSGPGAMLFEVFDATGRLLQHTTANSAGPTRSARLERISPGVLLVRASWPGGVLAGRLFVP